MIKLIISDNFTKKRDALIISTGNLIDEIINSANYLETKSINCSVFSLSTLKPLKEELIIEILKNIIKFL